MRNMPATAPQPFPAVELAAGDIGRHIRELRERLGVSQTDTAMAAGVSRVTLYRVERGNLSVTLGAYLNILDALGERLTADAAVDTTPELRPGEVRVGDYPQLKLVTWSVRPDTPLTRKEAHHQYVQHWDLVDAKNMTDDERMFVDGLRREFGD